MKNDEISKSFLKASKTYWLLSQFIKVNEYELNEKKMKIFESMKVRMLENIETLKMYRDKELNDSDFSEREDINNSLISINSYSEAVLQKLNFYLK